MRKFKIFTILFLFFLLFLLTGCSSDSLLGARIDSTWISKGTYIRTDKPSGYNVLINGVNKYLNFGSIVGSSGYGIRDNAGTIEFRHNGGSWVKMVNGDDYLSLVQWYATTTDALTEGVNNLYSQWGENGTSIYYNSGFVGIGTSSPEFTLDVNGNMMVRNDLLVDGDMLLMWEGQKIVIPTSNFDASLYGIDTTSLGDNLILFETKEGFNFIIDSDNNSASKFEIGSSASTPDAPSYNSLFTVDENGNVVVHNNLVVQATTTFNNVAYKFPSSDGIVGQVLTTNGAGQLSWSTAAGSGDITAVFNCTSGDCLKITAGPTHWLDMGGADFLIIPLDDAVATSGSITIDQTEGQLVYYSGQENVLSSVFTKGFNIESPAVGDETAFWLTPYDITLQELSCQSQGVGVNDYTTIDLITYNSTMTATTSVLTTTVNCGQSLTSTTGFSSASILSGTWIGFSIRNASGTAEWLPTQIKYRINRK